MNEPKTKNKMIFKPLSEGLGFQPFSEGLPYQPVATRKGAMPDRDSSPPLLGVQEVRVEPLEAVPRKVASARSVDLRGVQPEPGAVVYWLARCLGFCLDGFISVILILSAIIVISANTDLDLLMILTGPESLTALFVFAVACYSLVSAQEIFLSTTLGKRFFRLELRGRSSALFLRSALFPVLGIFLPIQWLAALATKKRVLWHDGLSGTSVQWMKVGS